MRYIAYDFVVDVVIFTWLVTWLNMHSSMSRCCRCAILHVLAGKVFTNAPRNENAIIFVGLSLHVEPPCSYLSIRRILCDQRVIQNSPIRESSLTNWWSSSCALGWAIIFNVLRETAMRWGTIISIESFIHHTRQFHDFADECIA